MKLCKLKIGQTIIALDSGDDYICSQCDIGYHNRCRGGDCNCSCRQRKTESKIRKLTNNKETK